MNPRNRTTASGSAGRVRGPKPLTDPPAKPPFDSKIFLTQIRDGRTTLDYTREQRIFTQGDPADAIFYIQKGKVKLTVVSKPGREAVLAILGAGDFFGESCLAGQSLWMKAATAMGDSTIIRVEKQAMIRLLRQEPAFSELFMTHLLSRNIRIEEDLVDQLFNSSEKRLARILLLLANFGKESKPEPLIAKISQETLAEMIGTTRSRVSFFMNKFRKLGFIEYNGGLHVHSSLLNVILLDQEPRKSRCLQSGVGPERIVQLEHY
ncbi:MAG TPA: Crp/Fnr family transcriptional regulator [Bryobacteraceae bacterium]|nr:Crp/Fnr family transcriptional regulator [Bryobacteraceae bacterium]